MIDINNHTKAIEQILTDNLASEVVIKRNTSRNDVASMAENGWIGIYKKEIDFEVVRIGPNRHKVQLTIDVEIQFASMDHEVLEKKLAILEDQVITLLLSADYKKLPYNGVEQVDQLTDIDIAYELYEGEETEEVHFQSSIITLVYEVQA